MDRSVYLEVIKKSPLVFKMTAVAPEVFSAWKEIAKKRFPNHSFKADHNTIVEDVFTSFANGLNSLFMEEKKEKRDIPGWKIGFIFGFVPSNLSTGWYHDYVYSETNEYKQLMSIKSIILYLNTDHIFSQRLEKLYKFLVKKRIDVVEKEEADDQQKNVISLQNFKDKNDLNKKFRESVTTYLESIMLEKHHILFDRVLEKGEDSFSFVLKNFFDKKEIETLIRISENV